MTSTAAATGPTPARAVTQTAAATGPTPARAVTQAVYPGPDMPLGMSPAVDTPLEKQNQVYRNIAIDAVHKTMAGEKQYQANVNTLANIAFTHYAVYGWDGPAGTWTANQYLKKVLALQHTDGGWHADPKKPLTDPVPYTIVTTDHVGPLLLQAYEKGKVGKTPVQKAVNFIMSRKTKTGPSGSLCILNSLDYPNNAEIQNQCVGNMNVSAAWFLYRAKQLGITVPGVDDRIAKFDLFDKQMRRADKRWPYNDRPSWGSKVLDLDHNALNAVAHREIGQIAYGNESIQAGWPTNLAAAPDPGVPLDVIKPTMDLSGGHYVQNLNARLRLTAYWPKAKCKITEPDAQLYMRILDQANKPTDQVSNLGSPIWMIRYSQLARYSSILANRCQP